MDTLKVVWRVCFFVYVVMYSFPRVFMQLAFSMTGSGYGEYGMESLMSVAVGIASLLVLPLLVYVPVELFFDLHSKLTKE